MRVSKSRLSGSISLPPSKSHTMRSLILAAQAEGRSRVHNPLPSPDTQSMVLALQALGIPIKEGDGLEIEGGLKPITAKIDVGNSGLAYRFITAVAALGNQKVHVTGDHSIRTRRIIQPLLSGIEQLGGKTDITDGIVTVCGPIKAGHATLDGTDSQPVSALLMAASSLEGETMLYVENPGEKPWIDLTLFWLKRLGATVENESYTKYRIKGGFKPKAFEITIPADWSSAAFPIVAALITQSPLEIQGLDLEDPQGDKKIMEWLAAHLYGNLFVRPGAICGGTIDVNDSIDSLPILAVLGCFAQSPLHLVNASIARKKESDRLHAITLELRKMGGIVLEFPDSLTIYPSRLHGAVVDSHEDHRIAMALAVAGMGASGTTEIQGASCIEKSFPNFTESFRAIGANIS